MKKEKNELLQFLGGLLMMAAGVFIFCQKVQVSSSLGFGRFSVWGMSFNTGLVIVPLIIGIIWMFISDGSLASKLFTTVAFLFIVIMVIMTTHFYIARMSLYEWILIFVLMFGGGAWVAKIVLADRRRNRDDDDYSPRRRNKGGYGNSELDDIDSQLDEMRRNMRK